MNDIEKIEEGFIIKKYDDLFCPTRIMETFLEKGRPTQRRELLIKHGVERQSFRLLAEHYNVSRGRLHANYRMALYQLIGFCKEFKKGSVDKETVTVSQLYYILNVRTIGPLIRYYSRLGYDNKPLKELLLSSKGREFRNIRNFGKEAIRELEEFFDINLSEKPIVLNNGTNSDIRKYLIDMSPEETTLSEVSPVVLDVLESIDVKVPASRRKFKKVYKASWFDEKSLNLFEALRALDRARLRALWSGHPNEYGRGVSYTKYQTESLDSLIEEFEEFLGIKIPERIIGLKGLDSLYLSPDELKKNVGSTLFDKLQKLGENVEDSRLCFTLAHRSRQDLAKIFTKEEIKEIEDLVGLKFSYYY